PDHELIPDLLIGGIVCPLKRGQRAVREDDAPAVGHICGVALDNCDIVGWMSLFDEQTTIEARRSRAKNDDLHLRLSNPLSVSASISSWAILGMVGKRIISSHPASS